MTSRDVTPEQAEKITARLTPALVRLGKLESRMQETGFPPGDALMRKVKAAHEAVRWLRVKLHELEKPGQPAWMRAQGVQDQPPSPAVDAHFP